jgi:hypothetical protein
MRQAKPTPPAERQAWHYDAFERRPDWAKALGRQSVIRRQRENLESRRRQKAGAA